MIRWRVCGADWQRDSAWSNGSRAGPAGAWGRSRARASLTIQGCGGRETKAWRRPGACGGAPSLSGRTSRQRWASAPHLPFPSLAASRTNNGQRNGQASSGRAPEWKGHWAAMRGRARRSDGRRDTSGFQWGLRSFAPPGQQRVKPAYVWANRGEGMPRGQATHTALRLPLFACKTSFAKRKGNCAPIPPCHPI